MAEGGKSQKLSKFDQMVGAMADEVIESKDSACFAGVIGAMKVRRSLEART